MVDEVQRESGGDRRRDGCLMIAGIERRSPLIRFFDKLYSMAEPLPQLSDLPGRVLRVAHRPTMLQ
jgi:hypothetical protein